MIGLVIFLPGTRLTAQGGWLQHIPEGFSLLDTATADFTQDGISDMLLIARNKLDEDHPDTARALLILEGLPGGGYKLFSRNDSVVLCKSCGGIFGDPYAGITVKKQYFSIEHYGGSNWRWTRVITFRYDVRSKKLLLHRDAGESWHVSDLDKVSKSVYNQADFGKLPFDRYSVHKDSR